MQEYFDLPQDFIYLNTGTMALTPRPVLQAVARHKQEMEQNPSIGLFYNTKKLWDVQKKLAHYLRARPEDLYLRTNVSYAINDFLMALRLPKNSEILLSNLEYGAVEKICCYKAEIEGHEVKLMELPLRGKALESLDKQLILAELMKKIGPKTKLVVCSHIATGNGLRFPIEEMAAICRAKKIFFCVDGAHGFGSAKLDFSQSQVDFYGSNIHKWFMGPKGTGWAWVNPLVREHLEPKFAGWTTFELLPQYQLFGDPWTARWMISSTHNSSDFYGISDILDFWDTVGEEKIFSRQQTLRAFAQKEISRATLWPSLSNFPEELTGPLVSFVLPEALEQKGASLIVELLQKHGLQISITKIAGQHSLRVSPHIYNNETEIERAATTLANL